MADLKLSDTNLTYPIVPLMADLKLSDTNLTYPIVPFMADLKLSGRNLTYPIVLSMAFLKLSCTYLTAILDFPTPDSCKIKCTNLSTVRYHSIVITAGWGGGG